MEKAKHHKQIIRSMLNFDQFMVPKIYLFIPFLTNLIDEFVELATLLEGAGYQNLKISSASYILNQLWSFLCNKQV